MEMSEFSTKFSKLATTRKQLSEKRRKAAQARWQNEKNKEAEETEAGTTSTTNLSTSNKKIDLFQSYLDRETESDDFYLIQSSAMQKLVSGMLCNTCQSKLKVDVSEVKGFARKLTVKCSVCDNISSQVFTSDRVKHKDASTRPPFLVNRVMVESFLATGQGYSGMERFCMESGIAGLSATGWKSHLKKIEIGNDAVKKELLEKSHDAVRVAHGVGNDEVLALIVSYDGTWQKRGHKSLNGCAFVVDILTGLVIDYVVLSKYCSLCTLHESQLEGNALQEWKTNHKETGECQINFEGYSGGMEVAGAEIMWKRSLDHKMRYLTILSDGDAKTFIHLQKLQLYGEEEIKKEECVNHVEKRLGTGLRDVIECAKNKNEVLGGKGEGKLTQKVIDQLCHYYRNAIVQNLQNTDAMQSAILATLYHTASTDKAPKHQYCPKGEESWCFWQKAKALKQKPKAHSEMSLKISPAVFKHIKPLYERLSATPLLERCSRGATQNANESLHAQVWRFCKKEVFVTKPRLEVGVNMAVGAFNMGGLNALSLRKELQEEILPAASTAVAARRDLKRKVQSSTQSKVTKKRFIKKQQNAKKQPENKKRGSDKGDMYRPGVF